MIKSHGFYLLTLFLAPSLIWSLRRQGQEDAQKNETASTEQQDGLGPAPTPPTQPPQALDTQSKLNRLKTWLMEFKRRGGGYIDTSWDNYTDLAVNKASQCFPPTAWVRVADPKAKEDAQRRLADLRTGDSLLSAMGRSNTFLLDFHEGVLDRNTSLTKYLRIEHALQKPGRPLLVTANHLVFVVTGAKEAAQAMPASEIRPGHVLLVHSSDASGDSGKLIESRVTSVGSVVLRGFAGPLSSSGTLFVEDVLVSSYALGSDAQLALWQRGPAILRENTHSICHILALPFRWAHALGWGSAYLSALSASVDALSVGVRLFRTSIV